MLKGVTLHNVDDVDIDVPLGRLVVITGVSGSGKSTVARDVLYTNLKRLVGEEAPGGRARAAKNAAARQAAAATKRAGKKKSSAKAKALAARSRPAPRGRRSPGR